MKPLTKNQKIAAGVAIGVVVMVVAVLAFVLGRNTSGAPSATVVVSTTASATTPTNTVRTGTTSTTGTGTTTNGPAAQQGPYSTMDAALKYVQAQTSPGTPNIMNAIEPEETWREDDILHVIHATPSGTASYGGDFYYFFVNGYKVGEQSFTDGIPAVQGMDNVTYVVSFKIYLPQDPHCCPTGGNGTARFRWDGSRLQTLDSLTGASMQ